MESGADWETSTLFSPSKAREQQAQAKDWQAVDSWLARKYGSSKRLPPFERNEETLHALLNLATVNQAAEEQRFLVERVEKAFLQANLRRTATEQPLHQTLLQNLDKPGLEAVDALAEASMSLGATSTLAAAQRLCDLITARFEVSQQLKRAETQRVALQTEKTRLENLLAVLKSDQFNIDPDLPEQSTEWIRSTKQLKAKVAEYDDRLNLVRSESTLQLRIEDFTDGLPELQTYRARMAELKAKLAAFEDLPSDPKDARAKLDAAKAELRRLVLRRDGLFENMARR